MKNSKIKNGIVLQFGSAILFVIFSFCFLYFFQSETLAAFQHVLSHGLTVYNDAVGAVLITLVLYLLQMGVARVANLRSYTYALTYFPSFLLLLSITCASVDQYGVRMSMGQLVMLPLLLLAYVLVVYIIHQNQLSYLGLHGTRYGRIVWVNLLLLLGMMMFTAANSQTSETFHYRMRMERALMDKKYAEVNQIGEKMIEADSTMTMLRAYALAKQNMLGERLFTYPVIGGSRALLPDSSTMKLVMLPQRTIYNDLGACLKQQASPLTYLRYINRHHLATPMGHDYLLVAYLLDKKLDTFAKAITAYYEINDSLPRHYREALTLYVHQHSMPMVSYSNSVMNADYRDYQQLYQSESNKTIRQAKLRDSYGNTYWYYYQYGN